MFAIVFFKRTHFHISSLNEIELILVYVLLGYFSNELIVLKRF